MQGFSVVRCDSDLRAFAQMCAAHKAGERVTLLLVEPARLSGLAAAVALAAIYAPRAQIWRFEAGAPKPLAAYEPPATKVEVPVTLAEDPVRMKMPPGPPRLRLAGEGAVPVARQTEPQGATDTDSAGTHAVSDASSASPLLTDEELAMLLSTEKIRRN